MLKKLRKSKQLLLRVVAAYSDIDCFCSSGSKNNWNINKNNT
jgi:hypothetical protein